MYKEPSSIETTERQEAHEKHEAPRSVEKSAAEIGEQMIEQAGKEVADFQQEGIAELALVEARAEKEGLSIDGADKEELQGLGKEVIIAKEELVAEIMPPLIPNIPPPLPQEYLQRFLVTPPPLPNTPPPLPAEYLSTILPYLPSTPPPLPEEYLRSTPPPLPNMPPPLPEMSTKIQQEEEKSSTMKERVIENPELLSEKEASKKLLSEERIKLAQEIREQRNAQGSRLSRMKNVLETGQEKLEGEQGDKQFGRLSQLQSAEANLMAERISSEELSEQDAGTEKENMNQLIENSEKLKSVKEKIKEHYEKAGEISRERFETIQKSVEQTALRNGVFFVHTIQESSLKRHNELSNVASEATYEDDTDILLSLEPTISASSIFSGKSEEGKVSGLWSDTGGFILGGGDIQYADRNDADSVSEGIKKRTIVGGPNKQSIEDIDKVVSKRGEMESMIKERDGVKMQEQGSVYNEFIINNPKVFGYYQPVGIEEDELFADGKYYAGDISTKTDYEELTYIKSRLEKFKTRPDLVSSFTMETPELYQEKLSAFQAKIARFKERFEKMAARGNSLYIMTPDKSMHEYNGVNEDGSVNMGKQLTPEEVATGRAGLSTEKRKELGEKVLEKKVFKKQETAEEARQIINNL